MAMAQPRLVLGNRVNVSDSFDELVKYSGNNVSTYQINADGAEGSFGNSIQFTNVVPPNVDNTVLARNFRVFYQATITYDKTVENYPRLAGVNVDNANNHTLGAGNQVVDTTMRPYPLSSISDTIQLTLNSSQLSYQSRLANDVIQRFIRKDINEYKTVECPTAPDNRWALAVDCPTATAPLTIGNYADWAAVVADGAITTLINGIQCVYIPTGGAAPAIGTVLDLLTPYNNVLATCLVSAVYAGGAVEVIGQITVNSISAVSSQPLSSYTNSSLGASRGAFLPYSVSTAGDLVSVKFSVVEPVFCSPLSLMENEAGLGRVNTASLLYTYSKLQTDFLVSANASMSLGANGGIVIGAPKLVLQYITVDPEIVKIPAQITYPYESVVVYNKVLTNSTMPATQTYAFQTDTIRLSNCPHRIYLVVRRQITQRTSQQTSTFFGLGQLPSSQFSGLAITYGNRTGLLSATSNADLYRMASKNGYNGSFNEWQQAGVYCIDPVSDLGLDPKTETLPLEQGFNNIQINGYYNSNGLIASGETFTGVPEVVMIVVYNGAISVSVDNVVQSLALLTEGEMNAVLKKAPVDGSMVSDELIKPTIMGSGLYSSAKSLLGKAARGLASGHGQKVLEYLGKM